MTGFIWDEERKQRTGVSETIFCYGKSAGQINHILEYHHARNNAVMLTRLSSDLCQKLDDKHASVLEYDGESEVAFYNWQTKPSGLRSGVGIVTAGTSDLKTAKEAAATLKFNGFDAPIVADVGVAGISRLLSRRDELDRFKVLIAVAGMEGALFSVLAGLVKAPVIAVPTSIGYGVSSGGHAALNTALASCAPGVVVVNIDNGFGAATAAIKFLTCTSEDA